MTTYKNRTTKTEKPKGAAPTHVVLHVRKSGERSFWTRCGAAWMNDDGKGFNIKLDMMPIDGNLVVREPKDNEAGEATGQ